MSFSGSKLNKQEFVIEYGQAFHYKSDNSLLINVFFLVADEKNIEDNWKMFSNMIAAQFQNSDYMSENIEVEKWNFYIIYVSKEILSKELKNKIENDRFSNRKIVEDCFSKEFNNDAANSLIIKHITNTDLKELLAQTQDKIKEEYKPIKKELWKLVYNDALLARDTDLQKQIVEKIILLKDEN
tara:strand:- start:3695 stop:4246 length:552 start_codon:yes stop_codon:yes gene_type:complete